MRASRIRSGQPPNPRRGEGSSGVPTIYNAMVAPLWTDRSQGRRLVPRRSRRRPTGLRPSSRRLDRQLADPVSRSVAALPDRRSRRLGKATAEPTEAAGRADQRAAARRQPRSPNRARQRDRSRRTRADIHPANKQEVGRRLALAAKKLAYPAARARRADAGRSGARLGTAFVVELHQTAADLMSGRPCHCGRAMRFGAGTCRYAIARVTGNTVSRSRPTASRWREVRYAWIGLPDRQPLRPGHAAGACF